ncbi:hypothetical protein [Bradyrhizobium manausense]|uniref:hypothetical protein n=1 Tax=Bradyrhizobium manausense TaxID=989370 RepID=UPI0012ED56C7|nr:hypothetical protein [Bradyrhizobium manausense]
MNRSNGGAGCGDDSLHLDALLLALLEKIRARKEVACGSPSSMVQNVRHERNPSSTTGNDQPVEMKIEKDRPPTVAALLFSLSFFNYAFQFATLLHPALDCRG